MFGTTEGWKGRSQSGTGRLGEVSTEMRLHVLAYIERAVALLGPAESIAAMQG